MIVNHQFERDREQDASRLFQAIFNEALDAMLIADDEGNYIDANPAACELLGLPREELIGCNISNFAEPGLDIAQAWRSFLEQGRITGEFRILHPNGTVRETEFAATADILPHRHLSVLRDITRRKQAESQILLLNAELEQRVLERTEELRLTNEELTREIHEHKRTDVALQLQTQRERLMVAIAQHIRQSLNLDEILNTTVTEVRQFLACDRVLIYRTGSDGMGCVITEALAPGCSAILGLPLPEEIFPQELHQLYCKGRIRTVTDIEHDELSACLAETLRQLGVKSKMVVPIIQRERLWGLLIAHQCETPRQWQQWEVDLLSSLATQVAIAIQQAELYSQLEAELTERKQVQQERDRFFNLSLDMLMIANLDGYFIHANPAWERILGFTPGELIAQPYIELVHPADRETTLAEMEKIAAGITIDSFENRYRCRDNSYRWLSWTAVPFLEERLLYGVARDITEHKQAEIALQESEKMLRLITDSLPVCIAYNDAQQRYQFVNKTYETWFGHKREEICGKSLIQLIGEDAYHVVEEYVEQALAGESLMYEAQVPYLNGGTRYISGTLVPDFDDHSQVRGYYALIADISERKRIEEDLRESQQKYQTLFEIFPIGIAITDEAGNIIEANPASEQILGVSTAEQTKRKYDAPTWQIIRPDGTLMPRSEFATVKALTENRTIKNFEVGVVKPDEEISWLSITAAPIPLPGYGVAIAYIDISDRKKAEERLRLQAERERLIGAMQARIRQSLNLSDILKTTVNEVRAFLQTDRVIIHRLQPDGSGQIVTESLASGWMPTVGWVISDPWVVDRQCQHDYQWNHIQAINDIFTANLAEYHIHLLESFQVRALLVVPIHGGETLWGLLMAHHCQEPRQWQQWEIDWLSSLATQIGIAIQQSELYLQLEAQLTELQQTEAALQQAKEAAEVANRAKSEFLATMSHELRTPLNGILGYAQILKTSTHLTEQQRDSLNIIHQCGEYLLTLISDVLDLSKIEARKFELFPTEFHLPNVLKSIADFFRLRAQQKGISFTYEILSPLPNGVRGDEKRLRQVLINLLNNAIKFTDKGGVTFKVGLMAHGSWLTAHSQEQSTINNEQLAIENLRFQVEDTGIGIELSQLTEIFLPFHQVSDRNHAVEGTGLGLAISQKLVQLMGSEIKVRSMLGEGSVFWFDLNLPSVSQWHESCLPGEHRLIGFKGEKPKVLIVDDKHVNRSLLRNILEPLGVDILEAVDGQDCLHKALEFQPHLILMDLIMPVLDGLEATRRVRQLPQLQDVVVIALSANVLETTKRESVAAGCQDFLSKPVQVQQLLNSLMLHLGVEGIYEEDLPSREAESKYSCISIVPPPPSELLTLSKLAKIGDIQGLLDRADQLEKWDNRFVLFVTQLRQLTKSFQLKQLRKFIQNYMTDNNSEFNL